MTLSIEKNCKKKINFIEKKNLSKKDNKKLVNNKFEKVPDNKEINNKFEYLLNIKNDNNLISYYYNTMKDIQNSKEYKDFQSLMQNSKNYIPKIQYNFSYQNNHKDKNNKEEYLNNYQPISDCIYKLNNKTFYNNQNQLCHEFTLDKSYKVNINNNVNFNSKEGNKNIINGYFENFNLNNPDIIKDLNSHYYIPMHYNYKKQKSDKSKHPSDSLSKDKESDSTSAISEKKEEEHDSYKSEKVEYLVEMFGRKGWVCKLCNNFNYETRIKCNRCGIVKRPKKLVDLHSNTGLREYNEKRFKKEDWICINCGNLNYSFRNFCNRCKIPKNQQFFYDSSFFENNEINNFQNYPEYFFSPSFEIFNDVCNF